MLSLRSIFKGTIDARPCHLLFEVELVVDIDSQQCRHRRQSHNGSTHMTTSSLIVEAQMTSVSKHLSCILRDLKQTPSWRWWGLPKHEVGPPHIFIAQLTTLNRMVPSHHST